MAHRKTVASPGLFGPDEAGPLPDPDPLLKPSRKRKPRAAPPPVDDRLGAALSRLPELVERVETLIAEIPKAVEFEPLAEHMYSFARIGPRLLESLESVKDSVPQIDSATRALGETAATLLETNQRLAESLMQFPTAEDYEPLAAPLVEFARISPALTEALRDAVISFGAVSQVARRLEGVSKSLRSEEKTGPAAAKASEKTEDSVAPPHGPIAESLETLANEIDGALEKIPKDPEYARVAEQLRELATVSPSLMDWMKQVKPLAPPLAGSVMTLRRVANRLRAHASNLRGEKQE